MINRSKIVVLLCLIILASLPLEGRSGVIATMWILDDPTPMMKAARAGDLDKVKAFVASGVKVSERTENDATVLIFAVNSGKINVVRYLLSKGADPNACAWGDMCPLWFAAARNSLEMVELLIKAGADTKVAPTISTFVDSPLKMAVDSGKLKIAKILLENGANVDELNRRTGSTPLRGAITRGKKEMVLLLLEKGADLGRATMRIEDFSPVDYARNKGYLEIVAITENELKKEKYRNRILNVEDIVERVYRDKNFLLSESYESDEIIKFTAKENLRLIKNAIFARKNYKFDDTELFFYYKERFKQYKPLTKKVKVSDVDKANLEYIRYMFEYLSQRDAAG